MSNCSCKTEKGCFLFGSLFGTSLMGFSNVVADVVFVATTQSMDSATCWPLHCDSRVTSVVAQESTILPFSVLSY